MPWPGDREACRVLLASNDCGNCRRIILEHEIPLILRIADEVVECIRIGERGAIDRLLRIRSHQDAPDGHLELLSGERVRNPVDLKYLVANVTGRAVAAQLTATA